MLDLGDIAEVVATAVREATAPLAKRIDELESRDRVTPEKGDDGVGLADALIDKDGQLVLTMTDGRTKSLGVVTGKDGETFTLDDFDIIPLDDGRSFDFRFSKGGECHSFEFSFPVPIYRDVWKEGAYAKGDLVTWGGSLWHCDKDTTEKPGTADWSLAVKKGRDGKDAGK